VDNIWCDDISEWRKEGRESREKTLFFVGFCDHAFAVATKCNNMYHIYIYGGYLYLLILQRLFRLSVLENNIVPRRRWLLPFCQCPYKLNQGNIVFIY
jgi:hypothetical protein